MATTNDDFLLSIDPGKFLAGVALWKNEELVDLMTATSKSKNPAEAVLEIASKVRVFVEGHTGEPLPVVCEQPVVYRQRRQKGNPNDLLYLMLTNGAILNEIPTGDPSLVLMVTWKGATKKEVMHRRILGDARTKTPSKLLPSEQKLLRGKKSDHNALDAVGIGLWKLKRL